ncbi:unnamed protein product [Rhizophagus irregularis]|nr:unnamed protein product [Rhizophagus irregularis]
MEKDQDSIGFRFSRSGDFRKMKKLSFVSLKLGLVSQEELPSSKKQKKLRFVSIYKSWFVSSEEPKIRSGRLLKNENPKIRSDGLPIFGKSGIKIRFRRASEEQKNLKIRKVQFGWASEF